MTKPSQQTDRKLDTGGTCDGAWPMIEVLPRGAPSQQRARRDGDRVKPPLRFSNSVHLLQKEQPRENALSSCGVAVRGILGERIPMLDLHECWLERRDQCTMQPVARVEDSTKERLHTLSKVRCIS